MFEDVFSAEHQCAKYNLTEPLTLTANTNSFLYDAIKYSNNNTSSLKNDPGLESKPFYIDVDM